MKNNPKLCVAQRELVSVWYPKFTPKQIGVILKVLGSGSEIGHQISKDDFVEAAIKGHLKIEKIMKSAEYPRNKKSPVLPYIYVSVGVLGYKNLGRYGHLKNKDLFGVRIITITDTEIISSGNTKNLTHVWFQKMFNLVFIELKKRHLK